MNEPIRIPDRIFNALVDGRLSPRVERETREALETDSQGSERAATWQRQSEALHAALAPVAREPLPLSMMLKLRHDKPMAWHHDTTFWAYVGVFAAGLAVGLALDFAMPTLRVLIGI
ncbi:anti-sigma factor family protein [Labrys neptuniae]